MGGAGCHAGKVARQVSLPGRRGRYGGGRGGTRLGEAGRPPCAGGVARQSGKAGRPSCA